MYYMGGIILQELYEHQRDAIMEPSCMLAKNNSFHAHFHSSIELIYTTKGSMSALVDGVHYEVKKDHMLIVSSYEVHHYYTPEESDIIITIVPLNFVPSLEKNLSKKTFAATLYHDTGKEFHTLLSMLSTSIHQLGKEALQGYCQLILGLLIDKVGLKEQPLPINASLSRNILSYIQNHYTTSITMSGMAETFGYSRSYLSKIFKESFNCTFLEYISSLRCRKAAMLLKEKDSSILEISMMSGFDCVRTFYRVFKKHYHMTPSQYAKNQEKQVKGS